MEPDHIHSRSERGDSKGDKESPTGGVARRDRYQEPVVSNHQVRKCFEEDIVSTCQRLPTGRV